MFCLFVICIVACPRHQCLNKGIICSQMTSTGKGSKVDLLTFKKWGKDGVIGYKTVSIDNREFVNFVWCKVCARNKDALLHHPNCKGPVKKAIQAYVDGTNFVTKHNVHRHLNGEGHRIALEIESTKPATERIVPHTSSSKVNNCIYKHHEALFF